jgi:hypothetical protein
MGRISTTLAARLRRAGSQRNALRDEARTIRESGRIPGDVRTIEQCVQAGLDPLHAAYVSMQNFTALFCEAVARFDELDPFYRLFVHADDEYTPDAPPISPLTQSYFTTWAFFDLRFGPDSETIGDCLLDTARLLGLHDSMIEITRRFQESRLGIYEHRGTENGRYRLRELMTNKEFLCHVPAGYSGSRGELWFVRLVPPLFGLFDYHVVFTTPYILIDATEEAWIAYLRKSMIGATDLGQALHEFLKYGTHPNQWNEFIFLAYHHHTPAAIFLAGLPDVRGSLPHGELSREP